MQNITITMIMILEEEEEEDKKFWEELIAYFP
jgi:hypothetical protein